MSSIITLYTAKICPYAQRVEIALTEAKAQFKAYQIDLYNKPEWYAPKVNPASKVPAIAYSGPDVPPENPSPESIKLAESLILVEFVADLYPESNLLPQDPILRAQARFFVDVVNSKFVPACGKFITLGEGFEELLTAIEDIQALLPILGSYALGEQFTIADVAIAPFVGGLELAATNELGMYPHGQGSMFLEAVRQPKYEKFRVYVRRLLDRASFKAVFDEMYVRQAYERRFTRG